MGALQSINGYTITTDNTVVELKNITDPMNVRASNVTIRNCVINGGYFGIDSNAPGLTVEDCTFLGGLNCTVLSEGNDAIIRRNNMSGSADGMKIAGNNTVVEDNYIHDLFSADVDPHHDGIQCSSATGLQFIHNWIGSKDTSGIAMFAGQGTWSDVLIENNYFTGIVAYCVYAGLATNLRIRDNVFAQWLHGPVTDWSSTGNVWSGNTNASGATVNP